MVSTPNQDSLTRHLIDSIQMMIDYPPDTVVEFGANYHTMRKGRGRGPVEFYQDILKGSIEIITNMYQDGYRNQVLLSEVRSKFFDRLKGMQEKTIGQSLFAQSSRAAYMTVVRIIDEYNLPKDEAKRAT